MHSVYDHIKQNNMTTLKKLFIVFIAIPVMGMLVFTLLNVIVSVLFSIPFHYLQHAPIWVLYGILIGITDIAYCVDEL